MVDFQKLIIWQKAHQLTLDIYKITKKFPKDELFGLISQMRKSSSSQPTNIAEGSGRRTKTDFKRFLYNALGSNSELKYQLILSRDLEYITIIEFEELFKKLLK
jgi:four helix bundle protein